MSERSGKRWSEVNRLLRINQASEQGFDLAAVNVENRGLKLILKSFAQERAEFAGELRRLIEADGGRPAEGGGWLAAVHRGWINIKAAMTIGQTPTELVVLREVSRGERVARQAYERALQRPVPAAAQAIVQRQYESLRETQERIRQLRGREGRRTVVRLFDSEQDAEAAEAALAEAGYPDSSIERLEMKEMVVAYEAQAQDNTTFESALAGAVIGAAVGVLLGLVAMISVWLIPGDMPFGGSFLQTEAAIFLGAVVAGLILGGLLGLIIGVGMTQDDAYRYSDGLARGAWLLLFQGPEGEADRASTIMKEVNTQRWPRPSRA